MAMLALTRLMAVRRRRQKRQRQRRRIQARDGLISTGAATAREGSGSPCEQDGNSQGGKPASYSGPTLPENILYHIHSLLPLRDAARAACVSHAFLNSWRCRPNLNFSIETLGLEANEYGADKATVEEFTKNVDHILKRHSGIGLKTLDIDVYFLRFDVDPQDGNNANPCHLDSWLRLALTSGVEELILVLPAKTPKYNFPCSLLSGKSGNSIQYIRLSSCAFRPTISLGCLRSLKRLHLYSVGITGDELGCLLSNSSALERLEVLLCSEILCLKLPRLLQRLSYLEVVSCDSLQVIESEAPSLSSCSFSGHRHHLVQLSLGEALQVKKLEMSCFSAVCYAREQLSTIVPNLKTLTIATSCEMASTPIVPSKFHHLKHLNIRIPGGALYPAYDFLSLASFLDASPSLETFVLDILVPECHVEHGLFSGDPSQLVQAPEHHHDTLKCMKITGFYPEKSLLELACRVLETATSLDCLTLGTSYCSCWRPGSWPGKCYLAAIGTYIEGKVASAARLDVEGPCTRRRAVEV
ncbi:unnamed protein product [Urochloa decumbens]|uniref:At1g61320/AtMIF1 LRR domain-containing protein n=1 Tax=Urochloa decumbens TaxID=240449 RepID=A0ABC9FFR5_9POAL